MTPEYVIMDASIKYNKATNPLQEGLFYSNDTWIRNFELATKYSDSNTATELAKKLQAEDGLPKRVLLIQRNGNNINVGDVHFS
jgi:hypothetical protein